MGSLNETLPPPPPIQDLKITLQCSYTIFPSEETERRFMFLSKIDHVFPFHVENVHFFPANPDFPPEKVSKILEIALGKLLVPFDLLAGRLRLNHEKDRLEIDCNSSGIGFAVASSEVSLAEVGNLQCPNPVFGQLILRNFKCKEPDDQPLCTVQVTSFKCGGFAMGTSISHVAFDGVSTKIFLENLASLAAGKPLAVTPCNDRKLLAARSPPSVTFSHPEFFWVDQNPPQSGGPTKQIKHKNFRLSANDIMNLKKAAKLGNNSNNDTHITGFTVVTAHIWRCRALVDAESGNKAEKASTTILYSMDIRKILKPALPSSFIGNAILPGYNSATYGDLERASFSKLVEMIWVGARRLTDEYVRSFIDLLEMGRAPPNGDIILTSLLRIWFGDVEYPWGKPRYCCPINLEEKVIGILPDIDNKGGVNILVNLPTEKMDKFQNLFFKFRSLL